MRAFRPLILAILLVSLLVVPSGAQRLTPVALRASDGAPVGSSLTPQIAARATVRDTAPESPHGPSAARAVIGGVLGGAMGTFLGGMAGSNASHGCQGDMCEPEGVLLGALIGEPLGLALGAHLGSGSARHERVLLTSLTSAGILVGGIAAAIGTSQAGSNAAGAIMVPLIPVLQLVAAVAIESH